LQTAGSAGGVQTRNRQITDKNKMTGPNLKNDYWHPDHCKKEGIALAE